MVCAVQIVPHSATAVEVPIRARLYPTAGRSPRPTAITVNTRRDGAQSPIQQPLVESFINGHGIQPWTHHLLVIVNELGYQHRYDVFFKRHCTFRSNRSIARLGRRTSTLRSEVVVLKIGANGYIDMIGQLEAVRVNWFIIRLARDKQFKEPKIRVRQITFHR